MTRQSTTIYSVQLLRAVAATLVVLYHSQSAFARELTASSFPIENYLFEFGAVGVHIFFVISGFIMVATNSAGHGFSSRRFLRRRLLRIYPIYWICAFAYLVAHSILGTPYNLDGWGIARALALWPGDAAMIIGPGWTLSYEMFFYLCFGLVMQFGLNRGLLTLSAAFAVAIVVGVVFPFDSEAWRVFTNSLLLEFLAGAFIGWAYVTGRLPVRQGAVLFAGALALFAGGFWFGFDKLPSAIIWGVPGGLLVLGLVSLEQRYGASGLVRRLSVLGDSSYVLYLIHILVITCLIALVDGTPEHWLPDPAIGAAVAAVLCIGLAELIHRRIEVPMLAVLNSASITAFWRKPPRQTAE